MFLIHTLYFSFSFVLFLPLLVTQLLSNVDESRLKRLRNMDNSSSLIALSLSHSTTAGEQQQQHHGGATGGGGGGGDWLGLLKDLRELDAQSLSSSGFVGDNVQLHVLQDAFLSLNNFFQLRSSSSPSEEQDHHRRSERERERGNQESEKKKNKNSTSSSSASSEEVTKKIQDYRSLLLKGTPTEDSSTTTTTDEAITAPPQESTVLSALLSEDLLSTQEILRRTQNRLNVLELIQSNIVEEHYQQQEKDREREKQRTTKRLLLQEYNPNHRGEDDEEEQHQYDDQDHHPSGNHSRAEPEETTSLSLHFTDSITYEEILKELSFLGASLSERSSCSYALGLLLDRPIALLDDSGRITNNNNNNNNHKNSDSGNGSLGTVVEGMESLIKEIGEELHRSIESSSKKEALLWELQRKEETLMEYRTKIEQIDIERNEYLSLNMELQILREKLMKSNKEESINRVLEQKNQELIKKVTAMEEQVNRLSELENKFQERLSSSIPQENTNQQKNNNNSSSTNNKDNNFSGNNINSGDNNQLRDQVAQLSQTNTELTLHNEQFAKEIQRLKTTIGLSEQRVKSILQDSMTLHSKIQLLEEENITAKGVITKLQREVEDMNSLRSYKEEAERKFFDNQKELMKYQIEVAEGRENNVLINKYHNDLITAERTIESLEQRLAEYSVELEKGKIAVSQLESVRETMKGKFQEIHDMNLTIHHLETQLKEVPYLSARLREVSSELSEYKMKVDKIPGLLAEIARLRGSSRASIKSLMEQDKLISTMKHRLKLLEKDNTLLKHENQSLLELEMKLKESNGEIKRLMNLLTEAGSSASGKDGNKSSLGGGGIGKKSKFVAGRASIFGGGGGGQNPAGFGGLGSATSPTQTMNKTMSDAHMSELGASAEQN
jgi:hypothetical protein